MRPSLCAQAISCPPFLHWQPRDPALPHHPAGAPRGSVPPLACHFLPKISRHGPAPGTTLGVCMSHSEKRLLCQLGKLPCKVTGNPSKEGGSLLVPITASQAHAPPPQGGHGAEPGAAWVLEAGWPVCFLQSPSGRLAGPSSGSGVHTPPS